MSGPKTGRRHIRLWLLTVIVATAIASGAVAAVMLTYRVSVERRYTASLRQELTAGLAALRAADFSEEAAEHLSSQGQQILILREDSGELIFQEDWELPLFPMPEPERRSARKARELRDPRDDGVILAELVEQRLGAETGSFFITDNALRTDSRRPLEATTLYLCGREQGLLFCLGLPVESTNTAMELAIRYSTLISIIIWAVTVVLLYFLVKLITRPYRRIADIAAQVANLDFSRRCPGALTTELNDLSQSINSMADSLEANVKVLQSTNAQLQTELCARTRQQNITSELLSNLSHDLKTPIAIISGYADGLLEGVARSPEKQRTYFEMILRESEEMQIIVSRMLALSRLESGAVQLEPEDFDLAELLNAILDSFDRELERRGLTLDRVLPQPCPICADYECVRQSLLNYVQNAVYHINGGNRIEVRVKDRGDCVRVMVRNSSAPIPEEKAARLWEKLYRGDPSRQRQNGEIGLGLAIVKGNMERLGCAYGFENDPDFPGVCFWLELPKADAERGQA